LVHREPVTMADGTIVFSDFTSLRLRRLWSFCTLAPVLTVSLQLPPEF
jgi:hypothetical protein